MLWLPNMVRKITDAKFTRMMTFIEVIGQQRSNVVYLYSMATTYGQKCRSNKLRMIMTFMEVKNPIKGDQLAGPKPTSHKLPWQFNLKF